MIDDLPPFDPPRVFRHSLSPVSPFAQTPWPSSPSSPHQYRPVSDSCPLIAFDLPPPRVVLPDFSSSSPILSLNRFRFLLHLSLFSTFCLPSLRRSRPPITRDHTYLIWKVSLILLGFSGLVPLGLSWLCWPSRTYTYHVLA